MIPLEQRLDYTFQNPRLLQQALTHKSFAHEQREPDFHNEKLEFLGDAVIDLVLGEFLIELFPSDQEGALSKKRASLVNEEALAKIARALELSASLYLGRGEIQTSGFEKPRLLASAVEALLGAVFLDGGFTAVREVVRREFKPWIETLEPGQDYATDYKTRLQEWAQKKWKVAPTYHLSSESGPAHDRLFTVSLRLKDEEIARGTGRSKKAAEQQAAKEALEKEALEKEAMAGGEE